MADTEPSLEQARERLSQALSQGQFALTMAARSKAIEAEYLDSLNLSFNGHVFNAPAVMSVLPLLLDQTDEHTDIAESGPIYLLNAHSRPVLLDKDQARKLLTASLRLHQMATAKFFDHYTDLKTKRNVKTLVTS